MSNLIIDKSLIESIVKNDNQSYYKKVNDRVSSILTNSIKRLSKQVPYISTENVVLQPYNEILSGAITDNSVFSYLLGVESAQLELNTRKINTFWRNLKKRLKFAWANRRKRKSKKNKDVKQDKIDFNSGKYNIYSLTDDLFEAIVLNLCETSLISKDDNCLYIVGKDDFGVNAKIKIEVCLYSNENFKFFINKKKGFKEYNLTCRLNCLNEKILEAGPNFVNMLKIFNVLYFYVNQEHPNAMFLESILYNVPDKLYEDKSVYDTFLKVVNYLTLKSINNFKSINDISLKLYQDKMFNNQDQVSYLKMMRIIAEKK